MKHQQQQKQHDEDALLIQRHLMRSIYNIVRCSFTEMMLLKEKSDLM